MPTVAQYLCRVQTTVKLPVTLVVMELKYSILKETNLYFELHSQIIQHLVEYVPLFRHGIYKQGSYSCVTLIAIRIEAEHQELR